MKQAVLRAWRRPRPRLLPALIAAVALLIGVKVEGLLGGPLSALVPDGVAPSGRAIAATGASSAPAAAASPTPSPAPTQGAAGAPAANAASGGAAAAGAPAASPPEPTPEQRAERALLESLRARRGELDARDQAVAAREMVLAAAERRLAQRVEELTALQRRLEASERAATEREEAGWKQMVKLYEGMRPRDAAAIFDDLEMPVLVRILDRMGERKAAPVIAAMRPERARQLTTELARHRARPAD